MSSFIDPENIDATMERIREARTMGEIKTLCDEILPKWILGIMKGYSPDYPTLKNNHILLCSQMNVKPQGIVIVDYLPTEDDNQDYNLIRIFTEIMTLSGFVVRKKTEFISCPVCNLAIPTESLYSLLVEKNTHVPPVWSNKCSSHE